MRPVRSCRFLYIAIALCAVVTVATGGRTRAATFVVTDTSDNAADSGSLAYALTNLGSGSNTIDFAIGAAGSSQTITLSSNLPTIAEPLTVDGASQGGADYAGPSLITIDGASSYRVFNIAASGDAVDMSGVTIRNGTAGDDDGGGIWIQAGTVNLTNCTLSGNSTDYGFGGGICVSGGTLAVTNCTLSGNSANSGYGGGICVQVGTLAVTNCTLSGNSALNGGGICVEDGTLAVTNCTLSDNSGAYGGGICVEDGTLAVTNCTLSGNSGAYGGGIYVSGGTLAVTNCTLSGNSADGGYGSGGIFVGGATLTLTNCILYSDSGGEIENEAGSITANYCDDGDGAPSGTGNIDEDPLLGALQNNGGPTETMALGVGSPCYGAGLESAAPPTDQRGVTRPSPPSMGAYDAASGSLLVTNTGDSATIGSGSLRAAMTYAEAHSGSTITFAPGLSGTILLGSALPIITVPMTIQGPAASAIAIDGAGSYQPFNITSGGTPVAISDLTIQNGTAANGGGIYNAASITLTNCTLSGNSAQGGFGGGISNAGTATLTNCTLSGNSANFGYGGGIDSDGTLTLTNCTLSGNSANFGYGGGIDSDGTLTLTNCTLSGNGADGGYGGGIFVGGATLTLTNCILYSDSGGEIVNGSGSITANDCDDGDGAPSGTGNIDEDPLLGALQDNGGPTETMALGVGSPCYGAGTASGAPATDQRGVGRPSPPSIGAYDFNGPPLGTLPPPAFNPGSGTYSTAASPLSVTLSDATGGASFYYTTDGSAPLPGLGSSQPYSPTLSISGAETVNAVAVEPGYYASSYNSASYAFSASIGSLLVTNTGDSATVGSGSLRAAMTYAEAHSGSTITFAPGLSGTILLGSALPIITVPMTIEGPGASTIAVDGGGACEPFDIDTLSGTVSISGLTIQNGYGADGGGICVEDGTLAVTNCTLSGNSGAYGGGICVSGGTLAVTNCTLSGNSANSGYGGGICVEVGTLAVTNCTLSGNSADGGLGGGIYVGGGTLAVTNCTLSGNSADGGLGGGINVGGGTLAVTNCTLSGNSADGGYGGGIFVGGTTLTLTNCILYSDSGGEIVNGSGSITANYCDDGDGAPSGTGNIDEDPLLGALQDNGGPTETMALGVGSPCYGAGTASGAPATDQRGVGRPTPPSMGAFDYLGNPLGTIAAPTFDPGNGTYLTSAEPLPVTLLDAAGGATVYDTFDGSVPVPGVGTTALYAPFTVPSAETVNAVAVETGYYASTPSSATYAFAASIGSLVVTNTGDSATVGSGSLRAAMTYAEAHSGSTITFAPGLSGTILLGSALPIITVPMTIEGPGASAIAVDGGGSCEPFDIDTSSGTVSISGLTIQNGYGGYGGGICVQVGTLAVTNCTLSGNSALNGGGIGVEDGTLAVTNCTLSGNSAAFGGGGGICVSGGTLAVTNCTLSGNSADGGYGSGGIFVGGATLTLTNCILYSDSGGEIVNEAGSITANYCDDGDGAPSGTGNIDSNPLLGALQDNGGPTPTMALGVGSPCYGAGTASGAPATDQRGVGRPTPPSMGAYDYGTPLGTTTAPTINPNGGAVAKGQTASIADAQAESSIFDTADGSLPIPDAGTTQAYGSPITLSSDQTVDAVAVAPGYYVSAPASAMFEVVDRFTVSVASPPEAAGSPFTVTVTAVDAGGNTVAGYAPPMPYSRTLGVSDGGATLGAITWSGGVGTFTATLTVSTSSQTIAVADGNGITGTGAPFAVVAGPAAKLLVSAPPTAVKGGPVDFTVTALDAYGNIATAYSGDVRFTSSDGAAALPAASTLTNGTGSFTATLNTDGSQTITATDTITASIAGAGNPILVGPGLASRFAVSAPPSATAGSPTTFTVTALDQYNNVAAGYAGTVHFTSTDGGATVPANSTLTSGVGTFSATLVTAGTQTIAATDAVNTGLTGASGPIAVSPGPATHFVVSAPTTASAGTPIRFTVTAKDQYDNVATGYAGTVAFTTTDGAATAPGNAPLTSGAGSFSITLDTLGSQTITAADTVTSSIAGTSGPIVVSPGPAIDFIVSAPPTVTAGVSFGFTATAMDVAGNTATGYAGVVNITNPTSGQVLFANVRLTAGTGTLNTRFYAVGTEGIKATDTVNSSITGTSGPITVIAGPATHLLVAAPSSATAGESFTFTVSALDAYDNPAGSYAGTVHFTGSDGEAVLPADRALTSGSGTFSATLYAMGDQTIAATDASTPSISGTSGPINVGTNGVHTFPPGLAMISVPSDYSGDPLSDVLGYPSPMLAVWDPAAGMYALTPAPPADALRVGGGYWVRFPASETITMQGTPTPTSTPFTVALHSGWNMIGDPFPDDVALSGVTVTATGGSPQPLATSPIIPEPVFGFSGGAYVVATELTPYEGYWVLATQDCTLSVPAP